MKWYLGQPEATKTNWAALQDAFKERYFPQEMNRWKQTSEVWSMKQKAGQSAIDYMACVELEARRAAREGDQLRCVIIQGLLPNTRQFVVTRDENDINSLRKWLTVVSAAAVPDPKEDISSAVKDIQRRFEEMRVHAAYSTEVKERVSPRSASQSPTARSVQLMVPSRSSSTSRDDSGRSRSVYADESWRNGEGDVLGNCSHDRRRLA